MIYVTKYNKILQRIFKKNYNNYKINYTNLVNKTPRMASGLLHIENEIDPYLESDPRKFVVFSN